MYSAKRVVQGGGDDVLKEKYRKFCRMKTLFLPILDCLGVQVASHKEVGDIRQLSLPNTLCNHGYPNTLCNHGYLNTLRNHGYLNTLCNHGYPNTLCDHGYPNTLCDHGYPNTLCNHGYPNTCVIMVILTPV